MLEANYHESTISKKKMTFNRMIKIKFASIPNTGLFHRENKIDIYIKSKSIKYITRSTS